MPWLKVDDGFLDCPKLLPLENDPGLWADCLAVWLAAGVYCARAGTDGHVPRARLIRLTPLPPKRALAAASALVDLARKEGSEHGLWERDGEDFRFHDWAEYQPSSEETKARKARTAQRVRDWRTKRNQMDSADVTLLQEHNVTPSVTAHVTRDVTEVCNAAPVPSRPDQDQSIVSAYADTHPLKPSLEGDAPGEPGSPVAGHGVAEHRTEASEPAQGKPEAVDERPGGFALTPDRSVSKQRGKTNAKDAPSTVEVEYARVIVGWLNAKRSAAGKVGKHLDPYSKVTIERVRWLRKQGWTPDIVLLALDLRVDQWRRIGERNGEDWTENLHPTTSLNGKIQAFIERAQAGDRVHANLAPRRGIGRAEPAPHAAWDNLPERDQL